MGRTGSVEGVQQPRSVLVFILVGNLKRKQSNGLILTVLFDSNYQNNRLRVKIRRIKKHSKYQKNRVIDFTGK